MVGDHGEYLNHGSFGPDEKKTGKNICQKVYNTLEETDSLRSLLFLAADGTAANSGINSKFFYELANWAATQPAITKKILFMGNMS